MSTTHLVDVVRVADRLWHALEDDCVVDRGHTTYRRDGRIHVNVDDRRTTSQLELVLPRDDV